MMNREDIMRELELLPVWQLRRPVAEANLLATEQSPLAMQETVNNQSEADIPSLAVRVVVSDDGQWLFALQQCNAEAETLFNNMLKAVNVNSGQDVAEAQLTTVFDYMPKVIIAMGEGIAQQLLALTSPLVQMRGKLHSVNDIPIIVTYAPDDLLQNASDKAGAWEDLCLAKMTVTGL